MLFRKNYKKHIGYLGLISFFSLPASYGQSIFTGQFEICTPGAGVLSFTAHTFASWGNKLGQTSLVDIDRDDDLDWVVGERTGMLSWFEYRSADHWVRHDLGNNANTGVGGTAFDVDGDGWIDQVSGKVWYRNPQNPRDRSFSRYDVGMMRTHDNVAADIDQDGKLDVVAMSDIDGLKWYKIPADPTHPWIETTIGAGVHGAIDPQGVDDLDGDGDNDIARSTGWFENLNNGASWFFHNNIPGGNAHPEYPDTTKSWIIDMDNDGDNDVVMSNADDDPGNGWVKWFENNDGRGGSWTTHLIASNKGDLHSLAVADFDNDCDVDVFSGEGPLGGSGAGGAQQAFIWENLDSRGGSWQQHIIVSGFEVHEAKAADVDGDTDIDIVFKPWNEGQHVYLENTRHTKSVVRLDNGINLNGWHSTADSNHGTGGLWTVENGAIVGQQDPPGSGNGGLLLSDQLFDNFEVNFEVWADWTIDSGLLLRTTEQGQAYQITIDMQNNSSIAGIYGEGIGGFKEWDFTFANGEGNIQGNPTGFAVTDWSNVWNVNNWNAIRAIIQNNPPSVETWINGYKANDYQGVQILLDHQGSIGLQVHGGNQFAAGKKIRFRNIRVRPL